MKITSLSSVLCLLSFLFSASALRAEEWGFSFSGQILQRTSDGRKLPTVGGSANYTTNLYVRLYDESSGAAAATPLWGRMVTVHTRDGYFTCELRDSNGVALPAAYTHLQDAFAHLSGDRVSVGVTPFDDNQTEITPRQTLVAVPLAAHAGDALGTVGDVTVENTLTIGAAQTPSAVFKGPVTHRGKVTFRSPTVLRSLALVDSKPFEVKSLAVGNDVSVSDVQANTLTAADLKAAVANVNTAVFSNLTLKGSASTGELTTDGGELTVDGDVTTQKLKCDNLVLGGSIDLFQWVGEIIELDAAEEPSVTYYFGTPGEGHWNVPTDKAFVGDVFVSLSFKIPSGVSMTISIADSEGSQGTQIAKLSASGLGDGESVWLPFQAFLRRGQKISWEGGKDTDIELHFLYRRFEY